MLIGELVPETLRFLRNNPASPELTAFDHIVVDEYGVICVTIWLATMWTKMLERLRFRKLQRFSLTG